MTSRHVYRRAALFRLLRSDLPVEQTAHTRILGPLSALQGADLSSDQLHWPNWLLAGFAASLFLGTESQCDTASEKTSPTKQADPAKAEEQGYWPPSNEHTAKWRVFTDQGGKRFSEGDTQQAEQFLKKAVQEAVQGFGAEDPHVAAAENNLAELYRLLGEHKRAEALYLSALQKLQQTFGSDDVRVAQAQIHAAGCMASQHRLPEAQALMEKAVQACKAAMGDSHPSLAPHLNILSLLHWRQGQQDAAIDLQRECCKLSLLELDNTPKHAEQPGYMRQSGELFNMLMVAKRWSEAAQVQQRRVEQLVKDNISILDVCALEQYSQALRASGKHQEALAIMKQCLDLVTEQIAAVSIHVAVIMQELADLELDSDEEAAWQRAHNLAQQSCEILQSAQDMTSQLATGIAQEEQQNQSWFGWLKGQKSENKRKNMKNRERATRAMPCLLVVHANSRRILGRAQARLGRMEEARASLQKAVSTVTLEDAKAMAPPAQSGDRPELETDDEATSTLMAAFKFSHAVGRTKATPHQRKTPDNPDNDTTALQERATPSRR
ncbi:hypothetical protein WJX73_009178 [Symbiochloris irregularis]|uniref:Kinesin light chain n=1 Tax=Symbiochloris irregularis TaxID=706552 RepID=A0AAW1P7A4_9CHLO